MKKSFLLLVVVSLLVTLIAGCGAPAATPPAATPATPPAAPGSEAEQPEEAPKGIGIGDWLKFEGPIENVKRVGYSTETLQTDFAAAMAQAVVAECEKRGWEVEVNEANNDPMKQVQQCEDMIAKGIDILFIKPLDESSFAPISQLCMEEGIPLFVTSTFLNSPYTAAALADQYNNGVICANGVIENNPGTIHKTLILRGPLAMESFNLRAQGAIDTLEAAGYEIVYETAVNNQQDEGLIACENFLATGVEFDSILCGADSMAIGAAIAVQEAGLADKVYVFGNGGQIEAAENLLKGGQLDGTIFLTPAVYIGTVFEAADNLVAGKPYEQKNMVTVKYMNADNVYDFYPELKK